MKQPLILVIIEKVEFDKLYKNSKNTKTSTITTLQAITTKRFTPQQEGGLMSEGIMKMLCTSIHIFSYFQNYCKKRGNYKPFYFIILTTLIVARQNVMRECHISLRQWTPTYV